MWPIPESSSVPSPSCCSIPLVDVSMTFSAILLKTSRLHFGLIYNFQDKGKSIFGSNKMYDYLPKGYSCPTEKSLISQRGRLFCYKICLLTNDESGIQVNSMATAIKITRGKGACVCYVTQNEK